MNQALTNPIPKASALNVMAGRYSVEPTKLFDTLKATVFKGATNEELLALVVVSNEFNLNPFLKQIYAFPSKSGAIVPVVSVDGWNSLANNHPQMDGLEFEFEHDADGRLVSCTAIFYRKDRSRPVKVTEYLSECRRNTEPWKMEHRMLRHKALIQGARVAFGFGGIYDEDEALDIIGDPVARAKPVKEGTPEPQFARATKEEDQVPGAEVPPVAAKVEALPPQTAPPVANPPAEPTPAPAPAPKVAKQTPHERDVKMLRLLLKQAGFTDLALINLLRETGVDESLNTLEAIGEMNPAAIRAVCEPWARTLEALKAAAKGEAA